MENCHNAPTSRGCGPWAMATCLSSHADFEPAVALHFTCNIFELGHTAQHNSLTSAGAVQARLREAGPWAVLGAFEGAGGAPGSLRDGLVLVPHRIG